MYQPWLARCYPGVSMRDLNAGYWSMEGYVAMRDALREE